ncbi:methylated-DNA--[protein]-cysteine S-methyltransferase [Subtercola endophyticus]|uniref:methylated-DNA--[protein]-cysteine S-methyltransferase n=1 Tax=Subtercola endophyticus TaxID=2895559 RepID=UPI001E30874F|nr:methylated-DNA--[protein]-cysteine S-methyltransferase [Subtercola endophyticus]UFS58843.1 methylated-DNA--[protein]-cysteine S-methyltransferase [Subtercola endophyticus]
MSIRHSILRTPQIGEVILVAERRDGDGADALVGVYFPGHWTKPDFGAFGPAVAEGDDILLAEAATQLRQYLAGERREFDVPMALAGTPFQEQVWAMLQEVPYGETTTYGELAERLGGRSLARMVGQAVGHNPLSIMVGCHRVVGANGSLTGYAGGLERKEFLLTLEGSALAPSRLF